MTDYRYLHTVYMFYIICIQYFKVDLHDTTEMLHSNAQTFAVFVKVSSVSSDNIPVEIIIGDTEDHENLERRMYTLLSQLYILLIVFLPLFLCNTPFRILLNFLHLPLISIIISITLFFT